MKSALEAAHMFADEEIRDALIRMYDHYQKLLTIHSGLPLTDFSHLQHCLTMEQYPEAQSVFEHRHH